MFLKPSGVPAAGASREVRKFSTLQVAGIVLVVSFVLTNLGFIFLQSGEDLLRGTVTHQDQLDHRDQRIADRVDNPLGNPDKNKRVDHFSHTALSMTPVTDKVTTHSYETMYGVFLLPYAAAKPTMKMLEIGLGCDMTYGPGASVAVWKSLFPHAELWFAEFNAECVRNSTEKGMLEGIHTVVGDQGDPAIVDGWIETAVKAPPEPGATSGGFDIVVDDGGHHNVQINTSFDKLWPHVLPGGLYFIEDLQVGKTEKYNNLPGDELRPSARLKDWIEQLLYPEKIHGAEYKDPIPPDVEFVFCQTEACVVGKKRLDNEGKNSMKDIIAPLWNRLH